MDRRSSVSVTSLAAIVVIGCQLKYRARNPDPVFTFMALSYYNIVVANIVYSIWFAAMGQACFSMGMSGALGVMYGAYLRNEEIIISTAVSTGLIDTGATFLATLFVVPAVLVFGLNMEAGPGLLFELLSTVGFAQQRSGYLFPVVL